MSDANASKDTSLGIDGDIATSLLKEAVRTGMLTTEWIAKTLPTLSTTTGTTTVSTNVAEKGGTKRIAQSEVDGQSKKKKTKKEKKPRPFDLSKKLSRHISFRLAYDGEAYSGFSQNVGVESDESVERVLFEGLVKCRLIDKRENCGYSRCGRTDKGVSAFGQIIALRVRSAFPPSTPVDHLPSNPNDEVAVTMKKVNKETKEEVTVTEMVKELDYIKMLNGVLPQELRVISWVPVTEEFSARFSCKSRTYRYFFPRRNLDLGKMREGLKKIVGDHDFRNMAKMDTEHVSNFRRVIYSAEIIETLGGKGGEREGCYFQIKGQAFLWHMVRNIVQVMFFIGRGSEEPAVVDELFDVESLPGKPNYQMASDLPLVLHRCDFNSLDMLSSSSNLWDVQCQLERRWERYKVKCLQLENGIDSLREEFVVQGDEFVEWAKKKFGLENIEWKTNHIRNGGGLTWGACLKELAEAGIQPGPDNKVQDHTKLLQRGKGLTYEEKLGQMTGKKLERYEAAQSKKKSDTVDKEFYRMKQEQGGSGFGK